MRFAGPRFFVHAAALEMHPLDIGGPASGAQGGTRDRILQHHQVLHQGLPRRVLPSRTTRSFLLKERVVDEYYDPIKKLFRIFRGRR